LGLVSHVCDNVNLNAIRYKCDNCRVSTASTIHQRRGRATRWPPKNYIEIRPKPLWLIVVCDRLTEWYDRI